MRFGQQAQACDVSRRRLAAAAAVHVEQQFAVLLASSAPRDTGLVCHGGALKLAPPHNSPSAARKNKLPRSPLLPLALRRRLISGCRAASSKLLLRLWMLRLQLLVLEELEEVLRSLQQLHRQRLHRQRLHLRLQKPLQLRLRLLLRLLL